MISTKDLSGLPNAERLKNFCKGLAALDIIMVEEEWSFIRHYTYNPAWRKGKEAFFATDGSDQSMIVLFAPEGCVINGVDSELYDWEEKFPRIEDLTDGMPPALQKLMGSREVKKMKSTFCVWTEDGSTWHCNPMDGEDASKDLLSTIDGTGEIRITNPADFELPFYAEIQNESFSLNFEEEQEDEDSELEDEASCVYWEEATPILKQVAAVAYRTAKSELKVDTEAFEVSYNGLEDWYYPLEK